MNKNWELILSEAEALYGDIKRIPWTDVPCPGSLDALYQLYHPLADFLSAHGILSEAEVKNVLKVTGKD